MSTEAEYARQRHHLHRILGVIGWHEVPVPVEGSHTMRFERNDDPGDWVELPRSMDALAMAETLVRAAFYSAEQRV